VLAPTARARAQHRGVALAKDRKTDDARAARSEARGGSGRSASGSASRTAAKGTARPGGGKGGRTRPPTQVVTQQRKPWGLIAGAVAVVVFATAVITYATIQVRKANEDRITSVDEIAGVQTFEYAKGQEHVTTPVQYTESPPVGGPHDAVWADCTGTVYSVDIRNENAVHSLEHGAVWIVYNPDLVDQDGIDALSEIVDSTSGTMLSPRPGLDAAVSLQAWNHQLKVDSPTDQRIEQFVDFLTYNADNTPEPGASCENPDFAASPLTNGQASAPVGSSDMPTTPSPEAGGTDAP
jgi:hypothetical protein